MKHMLRLLQTRSALLGILLVIACGDDPVEPGIPFADVAGTYTLSVLAFDPQGVLPEVDLLARIPAANRPSLSLTTAGLSQLVFLDPTTGLTRTVNGTFSTSPTHVRLDFGSSQDYRAFALSRRMDFEQVTATGNLVFTGSSPDGASRTQLLLLVPEWQNEQLLDPVPGSLRVTFRR
jgi:hypothetical protein